MKSVSYFLIMVFLFLFKVLANDKPEGIPIDGEYIYQLRFAEWNMAYHGQDVKVIIKEDSIKIFLYKGELTGLKKGDLIEEGLIRFHNKTSNWVIVKDENELEVDDVGGCSDGPSIIDFKNKIYITC